MTNNGEKELIWPLTHQCRYLLAEYCGGPFYWGWWLYERETNDGRSNWGGWGWLHCENQRRPVYDLLAGMKETPPPMDHIH